MRPVLSLAIGAIIAAGGPQLLAAQSLDRRMAAAPDGPVQFTFAAREGACGNGKTFYHYDESGWRPVMGDNIRDGCAVGPARVVIVRAQKEVVKIETYVGPLVTDPTAGTDLGIIAAQDAATYLLGLAASLDASPPREALTAAMIADSAIVTPALLAIVKDPLRPRDLRHAAFTWLARRRAEPGGVGATTVARTFEQIARNRDESESIRRAAVGAIAGLDRGDGIPALLAFARDGDSWMAKQAFSLLMQSGDPRARQYLREAVRRNDLPEDHLLSVIQGIGGDYATTADYKLLRDLYPSFTTERERDVVISTLARAGGNDNMAWLIDRAKSPSESVARRRQALALLSRSDDPRIKDVLKDIIDASGR